MELAEQDSKATAFVELEPGALFKAQDSPVAVLELARPGGVRVALRLSCSPDFDYRSLLSVFWENA